MYPWTNNKMSQQRGSLLCPLLFILYINDLPNISNLFKPILFADDATLFFFKIGKSVLIAMVI